MPLGAWLIAGGLLAAVVLFGVLPVLQGRAVPIWDANGYFGPMFTLVSDFAKAGRLLTWNPWVSSGTPTFAEPQLGAASPALLFFARVWPSPFDGFIAYWLALWIFGGCGMLCLARHFGAPFWGATVAALGFAASGVYTGNAEHTSIVCSFSFLPWIVWRFDRAVVSERLWPAAEAGVLWGLSALGGYAGLTVTTALFLALWGIARGPKLGRLVVTLTFAGGIAAVVMSPAFVSFLYEARGFSYRAGGLAREYALTSNALTPAAFASLFSPSLYVLRTPANTPIWATTDLSMTNTYAGALVLVLALVACIRPSRWTWSLVAIGVFCGCCAVGSQLPVRGWLYDWLPPMRYFRHPALFRAYIILIVCSLAAVATDPIEQSRGESADRHGRSAAIVAAIAMAAALMIDLAVRRGVGASWQLSTFTVAHLVITWSAVAVIFVARWRFPLFAGWWPVALIALAVWDAGGTLRMSTATLYDATALPAWHGMQTGHIAAVNEVNIARQLVPPESVETRRSDRNIPLRVAGYSSMDAMQNTFYVRSRDDAHVYRAGVGADRMWFSERAAWLAPTESNFGRFVDANRRMDPGPLVLHSRPQMLGEPNASTAPADESLQTLPSMQAAPIDLVTYSPDALVFHYRAEHDGWLLVTDRWSRSWTATVNGRATPVLGGNFVFRVVSVSRGDNLVAFQYRVGWYPWLVALSWITTAGVLGRRIMPAVRRTARA